MNLAISIFGFLSGLTSILTPLVFPLFILYILLFSRLGNNSLEYRSNTVLFSFLVIVFYYFVFSELLFSIETLSNYLNNENLERTIMIAQLVFLLLYLSQFISGIRIDFGNIGFKIYRVLAIIITSVNYSIMAFSGVGPLIGSVMVEEDSPEKMEQIKSILFSYSIGILFPLVLGLLIAIPLYKRLNNKKWWNVLLLVIVLILLIQLVYNMIIRF